MPEYAHLNSRFRQQRRLVQTFENEANAAWRKAPNAPTGLHFRIVEEVALKTKTHIEKEPRPGGQHAPLKVGIWGTKGDVESAKQQLKATAQNRRDGQGRSLHQRPGAARSRKEAFPVVRRITPAEKQKARIAHSEAEYRRKFLKEPTPMDLELCAAMACFAWPRPEKLESCEGPEKMLGRSFEALDPIRMEEEVYVIWRPDSSLFVVRGRLDDKVKNAALRIRGAYYQIMALQVTAAAKHILRPVDPTHSLKKIVIVPRSGASTAIRVPELQGEDSNVLQLEIRPAKPANVHLRMRDAALSGLEKLAYYRVHLTMRARLGTFGLTSYKKSKSGQYSLTDFEAMMKNDAVAGLVTRDSTAFDTLGLDASRLRATFTVEGPRDSGIGVAQIEVQFVKSSSGEFDRISTKWSRPSSDKEDKLVEVMVIDIARSAAWSLNVVASGLLDDSRFQDLRLFADRLDVDKVAAAIAMNGKETRPFVRHKGPGSIKILSYSQSFLWRFDFSQSSYSCDVQCFREFNKAESGRNSTAGQSRWSVECYNRQWDFMLQANANLEIGSSAQWRANERAIFPMDRDEEGISGGAKQFDEKLVFLSRLVFEPDAMQDS
ncbi:hypothetical protein MRB53_037185 [Persea americana]|nr:hypothetical protein MRB53_037185 [Persea americana]